MYQSTSNPAVTEKETVGQEIQIRKGPNRSVETIINVAFPHDRNCRTDGFFSNAYRQILSLNLLRFSHQVNSPGSKVVRPFSSYLTYNKIFKFKSIFLVLVTACIYTYLGFFFSFSYLSPFVEMCCVGTQSCNSLFQDIGTGSDSRLIQRTKLSHRYIAFSYF